eukprot:scaffold1497_cov122-Cylindrotheca_fusiformis.AAC.5
MGLGRRSCCGTTPMGEMRKLGRWATSEYGSTIQVALSTMSASSSRRKSWYSYEDLCGPRCIACSFCAVVQGVVLRTTGQPLCWKRWSSGRAGWRSICEL